MQQQSAKSQSYCSRYFLGVGRYTPTAAVQGEQGDLVVTTPKERQWKAVMRQWCRFQNMDIARLNKRIFLLALGKSQTKLIWCTRV